ncbi:GntR family transcriptional regulator [Roseobacter sp. HKCCA0434]|uniref:GntR family transcriptional regulator n=1 Tax=Roseobacter sp. HKCCA0434 TaxID=3079297 RepID=UPI002905A4A8|nr:GntR family transcriptional regulator [Roseobacter sp. HKCCA0434]
MTELTTEPVTLPLTRPKVPTATDLAFQSLFDAIVALRLPPGAKVSETDIAKQLDMSRQPVRDAFFRLSKLGFLSIRPQRATLITKISTTAVLDAVFIRTAVEVECLRATAAAIDADGIARLRRIIDDQRDCIHDADPARFHQLDDRFHAALCDMAGQAGAWELIQEQKAHMDRVRFLSLSTDRRQRVLKEHQRIVDALEAGDPRQADVEMRTHLGDIMHVLPRLREANEAYFEDEH